MTTSNKPHPSAFRDAEHPCPKCGSTWYRTGIHLDPDAKELPYIALCAYCKTRRPSVPAEAVA